MLEKQSLVFVRSADWRLCFALCEFIMLCCDEYILEFMRWRERKLDSHEEKEVDSETEHKIENDKFV